LLLVVENYPQLKSNENFLRLQDELAGTENRIAVERKPTTIRAGLQHLHGLFPNIFLLGGPDSSATTRTLRLRPDRARA